MNAVEAAQALVEAIIADRPQSPQRRKLLRSMVESVVVLAEQDPDTLDLKIAEAALSELVEAFGAYAPYKAVPKLTIFGSARTPEDDPLYAITREFAAELRRRGWMIVTGAGPGIMKAGMEGAGVEGSFGVNVVLPFEQNANSVIHGDDKLVTMRYFFTRKVMLTKESKAFAVAPGGFGTMDECFEILTLMQAGKSDPAPVVLLDTPGGTFWQSWQELVNVMEKDHYINTAEELFYRRFDNAVDAADYVEAFYRNYHSMRMVGDLAVLRVQRVPGPEALINLNDRYAEMCLTGVIETGSALPIEKATDDELDYARVTFVLNPRRYDLLRRFIDDLNQI